MTDNQIDRSQDSQTYYYDTAQRFTKMERGTIGGTPSFYQGYTLDGLANWSSFNNNGSSESRTHNSMNAVTVRGSTNLTYDANGNLTNDGNQKHNWDSLNRLIEVRDSSNNIICDYYYNADNLRVEKHHAGGSKEQFYYDGARVLVETDGSQNKVREYVNGGQYIDEVILVVNGSTYNYYMSDLRYCVTGFIDSSGNVVERARYDGYGKRTLLDASYATITTANVSQSYGYTGIRHDNESGLQYYRARYFDNYLGRFINHDPLGYVDGLNLYRGYFVVNYLDNSGSCTIQAATINGLTEVVETLDPAGASVEGETLGQTFLNPKFLDAVTRSCDSSVFYATGSLSISTKVTQNSEDSGWVAIKQDAVVEGFTSYAKWHESQHAEYAKNAWEDMRTSINALSGITYKSQSGCDCCDIVSEMAFWIVKRYNHEYGKKNHQFHKDQYPEVALLVPEEPELDTYITISTNGILNAKNKINYLKGKLDRCMQK